MPSYCSFVHQFSQIESNFICSYIRSTGQGRSVVPHSLLFCVISFLTPKRTVPASDPGNLKYWVKRRPQVKWYTFIQGVAMVFWTYPIVFVDSCVQQKSVHCFNTYKRPSSLVGSQCGKVHHEWDNSAYDYGTTNRRHSTAPSTSMIHSVSSVIGGNNSIVNCSDESQPWIQKKYWRWGAKSGWYRIVWSWKWPIYNNAWNVPKIPN